MSLVSAHELPDVPLPAGAKIPAGALQKRASADDSHRGLIMRSSCEMPLSEQLDTLKACTSLIAQQLEAHHQQTSECILAQLNNIGALLESGYKNDPDNHPANLAGLASAAAFIMEQQGALLSDVALRFCRGKQLVLRVCREQFGKTVYVPTYFEEHEFDFETDEQCATLLSACNQGGSWTRVCDYICSRLSIIRLPVQRTGSWRVALLANLVGASDTDVSVQVGLFYELMATREKLGAELSPEQISSLKAVLPAGSVECVRSSII